MDFLSAVKVNGKVSKTKVGTVLVVVSPVLATLGGMLIGTVDLANGIQQLLLESGAVLVALGIRDALTPAK